ncbi:oxytocin receptor-like [Oppia nitens]|uniref:oxytocin receptor-like n=1 Tax=Oppia nitens TaxID=1686743 RepID=UPI0023D998A7|nr:oxytocin receptor-like [Oppia nitens]
MSSNYSSNDCSSSSSIISWMAINKDNITDNISQVNGSSQYVLDKRDEKLAILEIVILSVILVLIVFGNSCVLIALQLHKVKSNRMYYFLQQLSISDMMTALFNVLPQLGWEITQRFVGGNILCKTIKYLQIFGPYLSSYVLVMMAIDRYQAICNPLSNCGWKPSRAKRMIRIAWFVSLVYCLPQIFIFSYQEVPDNNGVYDCWGTFHKPFDERVYVTWYAVTVFIIPFLILIVTHYYICREIWLNLNKKRKSFKILHKTRGKLSANTTTNTCNITKMETNLDGNTDNTSDSRTDEPSISGKLFVTTTPTSMRKSYRLKCRGNRQTIHRNRDFAYDLSPRTHSLHGLSRAKIKSVKITVVVILCYIMCSMPFICVQLWAYWVPNAQQSHFWTGPMIAILMLLPSLNSCVNPWIYLYFNQNLVSALTHCLSAKSMSDSLNTNNTKRSPIVRRINSVVVTDSSHRQHTDHMINGCHSRQTML